MFTTDSFYPRQVETRARKRERERQSDRETSALSPRQ